MSWPSPDRLHRTVKMLIDGGRGVDHDEAREILESLVLQVAVGADVVDDPAGQAALGTVVNAGHRAFLGGVAVRVADDLRLSTGWVQGLTISDTVSRFGGTVVDRLDASHPTLVIGTPPAPVGDPVLQLTYSGWAGGIVEDPTSRLNGPAIVLAGVAAAALGISEVFQQKIGATTAGRRDVGMSLWDPQRDWRDPEASGPGLTYLPANLWLLGLGHLGQAYAWSLGWLPYPCDADVHLGLVDFDDVIEANHATQLLVSRDDIRRRKARVVAAAMAERGIRTTIVERAFDEHFYPDVLRGEPTVALAGFDKREPRLHLGDERFDRVVDVGLGAGPAEYLDILVHTFPATESPLQAFAAASSGRATQALPPAYEAEIACQVRAGADEAATRCGMRDIAGVSVGAAFVGAFASTLAVGDILRRLHGGPEVAVMAVDLREPTTPRVVANRLASEAAPTFVRVAATD